MGSGGGTKTVSTGIDEEFKPYLEKVLSDVTDRYTADVANPGGTVADMDRLQKEALERGESSARDAVLGRGIYDMRAANERDLQNMIGSASGSAAFGGGLGSARNDRAMAAAIADQSGRNLKDRQDMTAKGLSALGEAGNQYRAFEQEKIDAPHKAASRYFGYLGNAPQTRTETGGGK